MVSLKTANAERWAKARLIRRAEAVAVAKSLIAAKSRYQAVQIQTGVPWYFIACVHEREASQNWNTQLGQGDPLNKPSVHVPKGRGPFPTWEQGAIDALVKCQPYAASNRDWSVGGLLAKLEEYNGLGYAARGLPSPYIWSGTDQYQSGKYVADGDYDPNKVDSQLGCAALLIALMALDKSIYLGVPNIIILPTPPLPPDVPPVEPRPISLWASILSAILSLFKRK